MAIKPTGGAEPASDTPAPRGPLSSIPNPVSPGGRVPGIVRGTEFSGRSEFGSAIPVVYGTARVGGTLVFFRPTAGLQTVWAWNGDRLRYDRVGPIPPQMGVVGVGSTTTTVKVSSGSLTIERTGDSANPILGHDGYKIYFLTGSCAGSFRTLVVNGSHKTAGTFGMDSALPFAPANGDTFCIGPPVTGQVGEALLVVCEAPVTSILRYWRDGHPQALTTAQLVSVETPAVEVIVDLAPGTWGSSGAPTWGLEGSGATIGQGMTLRGYVQFRARGLALTNGKSPDLSFEVKGIGASASTDANPADVIIDLLTVGHGTADPIMSAGALVTDLGLKTIANPTGTAASSYRTYCQAMGFNVSRAITEQTDAASYLAELLEQTNSTCVWTEGVLRILPLGMTAITANGATYTPSNSPVSIGTDDLVFDGGDPVSVGRTSDDDVFNAIDVTFESRTNDYAPATIGYVDSGHAAAFGKRVGKALEAGWVKTEAHAQALAAIMVQRSIGTRNSFRFRLTARWVRLEPCDLLSVTEPALGLSAVAMRITSITETEDGTLDVEAVEVPEGAGTPVVMATQAHDGFAEAAHVTERTSSTTGSDAFAFGSGKADLALENVIDQAVTSNLLADAAVVEAKIGPASITQTKIGSLAIYAKHLAIASSENLIANGTCLDTAAPADSWEGLGLFNYGSGFSPNGWYRKLSVAPAGSHAIYLTAEIPVKAGDQLYLEGRGFFGTAVDGSLQLYARWQRENPPGTPLSATFDASSSITTGATTGEMVTLALTAPAYAKSLSVGIQLYGSSVTNTAYWSNLVLRKKGGAEVVIDGSLTAAKLAADSLATSDYAETNGVPTGGVKMQSNADRTLVTAMARSTTYSVGNVRKNAAGLMYRCITAGTTASGSEPTTTGSDITDGTCHWATYAPLRVGPAGMQLGSFLMDEVKSSTLTALARSDGATATRVYYRGNSFKGSSPFVPVLYDATSGVNRLVIFSHGGGVYGNSNASFNYGVFQFTLQPYSINDNLDSLRYYGVQHYRPSTQDGGDGAGSVAMGSEHFVPVSDRLYVDDGTDTTATNCTRTTYHLWHHAGIYNAIGNRSTTPWALAGFLRVRLFNVYGYSASYDYAIATTIGGTCTFSTTALNGGSLPGGGGGGGGGDCMAPETPILVAPTMTAPLHAIRAGDRVWTRHEDGGPMGYHEVESVLMAMNLRQRVTLTDGRTFTCSINHRVCIKGVWRRADTIQPGEELDGKPGGFVKAVVYLGEGPVVQLSIPTARTFFGGDGLWQHNVYKE